MLNLQYDNRFLALGDDFFTAQQPAGFANPRLVAANPDTARLIGLEPAQLETPEFLAWVSGNATATGSMPLAMVYSGHQFGGYTPQLGDGRGLLLGQVRTAQGLLDLHLKGAGKTPYSRFADGRAVLRSTIREYLAGEALHGLGIPTTRALAIAGSDEPVIRERVETGAMLLRLARTHIRFGSFEYFHYRQQPELVQVLADHVLETYLPEEAQAREPYTALFRHAVRATARLVAHWQAVGFCHGVMNTDNMSILGETLDYGPYGFLDAYDPAHICNHSDYEGRYAYHRQPAIGLWNCNALAHALSSIIPVAALREVLLEYEPLLLDELRRRQRAKLGLTRSLPGDDTLIDDLLALLATGGIDYTLFFRRLCDFHAGADNQPLRDLCPDRAAFDAWAQRYGRRLAAEARPDAERGAAMRAVNPKYVLRNYLAEVAIRKAEDGGDYGEIERLRQVLARPFDEQPEFARYAEPPPDWGRKLAISCSS
ncbi:MAG: hypothetical protein CMK33_03900 [Porticoccaceae bacterium]|nr:hypothetical protein [Porticoccaceae bacterium]